MKKTGVWFRIFFWLIMAIIVIAGVGAAYNAVSLAMARRAVGIPGKLYDVNGAPMHLYCTGQGSPAIVLDTGLGDDFTVWAKVQPALSKLTQVCSYDRRGFGWSERGTSARDANTIADELHALLAAAGVKGPFVLMGHSVAGVHLRAYAARYRDQLAGLVFVDGATPLQDDRMPPDLVKMQQQQRRELPFQQLLMTLGWYRVRGLCTDVPAGMESEGAWIKADSCVPSQMSAMADELDAVPASGKQTIHAGPFGSLPILIFSRDPDVIPSNWPAPLAKAIAVVWTQMQEEAKSLSTNSRRIVAKGSDHYVQLDRPELVIGEVSNFVKKIRANDWPVSSPERDIQVPANAAWHHAQTGFVIPAQLAGLARTALTDATQNERDVSVQFAAPDKSVSASIYVFRPALADVGLWFDSSEGALRSGRKFHDAAPTTAEPVRFAVGGARVPSSLRRAYRAAAGPGPGPGPFRSAALAVMPVGAWLVSIEMSARQLSAEQLDARLQQMIAAIGWPDATGTADERAMAAAPIEACASPTASAPAAAGASPVWCRDGPPHTDYSAYRSNGGQGGYVLTLNSTGGVVHVDRSGKGPGYAASLEDVDGVAFALPAFATWPTPAQVWTVVEKSAQ